MQEIKKIGHNPVAFDIHNLAETSQVISSSVDNLLADVAEDSPTTIFNNNTVGNTSKKDRVLNLGSSDSDDMATESQGLPGGRKIYIVD